MLESDYLKHGAKKWVKQMPNNVKPIIQCDLEGNFIRRFSSIKEAEEATGISHNLIVSCAKGRYKTSKGFIFAYEENYPIKDIESHRHKKKGRKVAKVDKNTGEIIAVYDRMSDAARELGGSHKLIHKVVDKPGKSAYGYRWISQ